MLKVLLIDEASETQRKLAIINSEYPIEMLHARKYDDISKFLEQGDIDLLITETEIEKKEIFPVLHEVKDSKKTKTVPIMIMTNDGTAETVMKAARIGCIGYFLKSLDEKLLLQKIKLVMKVAATHHEARKHVRVKPLPSDVIEVQFLDPSTKSLIVADLLDISLGGMAFSEKNDVKTEYLKPHRRIQIKLKLNEYEFNLSCVVVFVDGLKCAVQFEKMPLFYQKFLSEFVFHRIG